MDRTNKFLTSLSLMLSSPIGLAASNQNYGAHLSENAQVVAQTLQELNDKIFAPQSIRIELLKNCPECVPILADWEYAAWVSYNHSLDKEKIIEVFNRRLNDDRIPFTLVAFRGATLVAVISLDDSTEPELSDFQDGNPWGESFHVLPSERGKGIGEELAQAAALVAQRLGYQMIHFYTSNPKNIPWYLRRGAEIVGTLPYHDHIITVLKFSLSPSNQ